MKVTAFIRKTAAKNNITDQARVYFRVRDIGGVDIKAASELSINPNHWSPERQGYKPRVALVSEEKKMNFDKDVQQITHLITKEYHRGVDGSWLKGLLEEYHHPGINARGGNKADEYLLSYQIRKYVEETPLADESRKHHLDNLNKVLRYERFRHEVLHQRGFHLCIDTVTVSATRCCTKEASTCASTPSRRTTSGTSSCGCRRNTSTWTCTPYSTGMRYAATSNRSVPRTACRAPSTASVPSSSGASSAG